MVEQMKYLSNLLHLGASTDIVPLLFLVCGMLLQLYGVAATDCEDLHTCIQANTTTTQSVRVLLGETVCFECHSEGRPIEWKINGVLYSRNATVFQQRNITHHTFSTNSTLQIVGTLENNSTRIMCCKQQNPDEAPMVCNPATPPTIVLTVCQESETVTITGQPTRSTTVQPGPTPTPTPHTNDSGSGATGETIAVSFAVVILATCTALGLG